MSITAHHVFAWSISGNTIIEIILGCFIAYYLNRVETMDQRIADLEYMIAQVLSLDSKVDDLKEKIDEITVTNLVE